MELRDLIARAACADCEGAEYVGQKVVFEDGALHQMWEAYLTTSDAILAAMDAAGLVVVPRDPTEEMAKAGKNAFMPPTTFVSYTTSMAEAWTHMVSASPFAKKEVG